MQDEQEFTVIKDKMGVKVKAIKKPRTDYSKYSLSEEEVNKLIAEATTPKNKAVLLLMLHSALRRDEVANLKIENIDWERKLIHLDHYKGQEKHPKNDEELTVPITKECFDAMQYERKERPSGFLFSGRSSCKVHMAKEEINYIVARLGKKAGLTNPIPSKHVNRSKQGSFELHQQINPHLLRHTCIRNYLKNGGDIRMAQKLARHSNIGLTLQTYGSPSINDRIVDFRDVEKKL